MTIFLKKYWLLIAVFIIFAFLRFYNLDQRIIFDWDQEQYSYQVEKIIKGDITLIGPRINNDTGFFLGPYFTYILVPFYLLRNLHPTALIDFVETYSIIFFITSYLVISKLFSKKHALMFLLLWSGNSLLVVYDTLPWNPLLIPLGIILVWLYLYKIFKSPNYKNFAILGLIMGFFSNIHFQFIFLIFFCFVMLMLNFKNKKLFNIKNGATFIASFFTMFLPLFVFDLRNNFLNSKLFFTFFFNNQSNFVRDRNVWTTVFTNFLKPFIYLERLDYMWLFLFIIAGITIFLIKKKKSFDKSFYISFLLVLFITPLVFYFYSVRPSEYYFLYLLPFVLITITDFIFTLKREYLFILLVVYFLAFNIDSLQRNMKQIPIGLYYKDKAIKTLKENINISKKFNVTIDAPLGFHNGYKYLLDWYEIPQSGDFKDPLIQIKLPPEKVDFKINDAIGLKIPKAVRK